MPEAQPPLRAGWASGMGASPPTGLRPAPPSVGVQRDTSVHISYNSDLRKTPTGLVVQGGDSEDARVPQQSGSEAKSYLIL